MLLLLIIICISVFFRAYKAYERFEYAHDGDIYSWIVKDIVVNKHLRLIGQETSQTGIFIGPLFYYSLVPFFLITNMLPTGAILFGLVLSILTILSYFYIFKKLVNVWVGLMAAFLQSVLLTRVLHDRWVVPTNTMFIWEIWFFYTVVNIAKGNLNFLPLLGFLSGLIWHISLAEAPLLLSAIVALFLARKLPSKKDLIKTFIAFLVPVVPLILFETRHGFIQLKAIFNSFILSQESSNFTEKFIKVLSHVSSNSYGLLFFPERGSFPTNLIVATALLLILFFLSYKAFISKRIFLIIFTWFASMVLFFSFSSKGISEYYFTNIDTLFLIIIVFALAYIVKFKKIGIRIILILFFAILVNNLNLLVNIKDSANFGYKERQEITSYILKDSKKRNFPCVGISYITSIGNQFGFRYIFYLNGLKLTKPSLDVPVYNISLPFYLSDEKIDFRSGIIGVVKPREKDFQNLKELCSAEDLNLTESLWGYVE